MTIDNDNVSQAAQPKAGRPIPTGRYRLHPELTTVAFSAKKLGVFTIRGTMQLASGAFTVASPIEHSTLHAVLAADTFTTPMRQRDEHVKSATLLDVANHPTIEFDSTGVSVGPDGIFAVRGLLSVHGHVEPSVLTVTSSSLEAGLVGFRATTALDRRVFGVTARPWVASARIDVQIEAVGSPVR
ncbi:MAG TPA: YceI family protein [Acidimicrobiales bacterium]|jgi:polyisoprenoid-binding protein YceI|nr:YceI family protein [Acidimicrobiales bacterium]